MMKDYAQIPESLQETEIVYVLSLLSLKNNTLIQTMLPQFYTNPI